MIQGLWSCQVYAIINVKLGDADADTYKNETMTSLLERWENIKKDKHGKHCHNQRKKFSLFFSFSRRNAREGSPSPDLSIELIHVREKGRTPFSSTGGGGQTDAPQSPLRGPNH